MDKKTYHVWANNDAGASTDVFGRHGEDRFTSITAAIKAARETMGTGWTIHVMRIEIDGTATEIRSFTIR